MQRTPNVRFICEKQLVYLKMVLTVIPLTKEVTIYYLN